MDYGDYGYIWLYDGLTINQWINQWKWSYDGWTNGLIGKAMACPPEKAILCMISCDSMINQNAKQDLSLVLRWYFVLRLAEQGRYHSRFAVYTCGTVLIPMRTLKSGFSTSAESQKKRETGLCWRQANPCTQNTSHHTIEYVLTGLIKKMDKDRDFYPTN